MGPSQRERRADESGDAALRVVATPCAMGNVPDAPPVRRARRTARVPGSVRNPHRAPAPQTAPRVRVLRRHAQLHRRVRHDRRTRRAGDGAVGRCCHCGHRRRFAPRRAHRRVVQSTAVRRRARLLALRDGRAVDVVDLLRPSIDRLLSQPSRDRGRRRRRSPSSSRRSRRRRSSLPRRLPTRGATRDRRRAVRWATRAVSSPPPRSSSASTSAVSTPVCSTGSRARSRRCASRWGAPAESGRSPWRFSSPDRISSISG